jgi:hypothetical protein
MPVCSISVTFTGASSVLSNAQIAQVRRNGVAAMVARLPDGTTTGECLQAWVTVLAPNECVLHAEFDLTQVREETPPPPFSSGCSSSIFPKVEC